MKINKCPVPFERRTIYANSVAGSSNLSQLWSIDKTFEFCYGHRVWTQVLDARFSEDTECACRHLHGHEAKVQIYLQSEMLNKQNMCTDFKHLNWAKTLFNLVLDHKFIVDVNDPLFPSLVTPGNTTDDDIGFCPVYLDSVDPKTPRMFLGCMVMAKDHLSPEIKEMLEGIFVVDFTPTSERLAQWVHGIVNFKMNSLASCVKVDWWETPKSKSTYEAYNYKFSTAPTFSISKD